MKYIINEDQNKRLYRQSDEFKNAFLEVLKDSWVAQIKNGEDPYIDKSFYNMFGVEFNSNISENYVFPEFRNFIGGNEIALEQVKRLGEKTYSTDTRYDAGTYDFTFNFEVDDTSKIDYGVVDVRIKNLEGTVDIEAIYASEFLNYSPQVIAEFIFIFLQNCLIAILKDKLSLSNSDVCHV